ncbi:hypothetical protein NUU61_005377 [Penicillium alfredii]|uniref:Uncharacterized protein n=1 Tax=Penicillium alfredii TaxID=1506179 RepID=A0A9W9F9D3_9EURO|nr:uncharacterized protein NUU61_005377 [Penicillium alfredii]KAJ5096021.1 hypothetical protein NUU61_005377 [Penicillium alfredii]
MKYAGASALRLAYPDGPSAYGPAPDRLPPVPSSGNLGKRDGPPIPSDLPFSLPFGDFPPLPSDTPTGVPTPLPQSSGSFEKRQALPAPTGLPFSLPFGDFLPFPAAPPPVSLPASLLLK